MGISERLMTLRVKLFDSRQATTISAYAPTLDATDEDKEMLYAQLDTTLTAIPESDRVFLLGDFKRSCRAKCGCMDRSDRPTWSWKCQGQWNTTSLQVCRTSTTDHEHDLPYER